MTMINKFEKLKTKGRDNNELSINRRTRNAKKND